MVNMNIYSAMKRRLEYKRFFGCFDSILSIASSKLVKARSKNAMPKYMVFRLFMIPMRITTTAARLNVVVTMVTDLYLLVSAFSKKMPILLLSPIVVVVLICFMRTSLFLFSDRSGRTTDLFDKFDPFFGSKWSYLTSLWRFLLL